MCRAYRQHYLKNMWQTLLYMLLVSSSDDVARVHEDIHLLNTIASDPTEVFFIPFFV